MRQRLITGFLFLLAWAALAWPWLSGTVTIPYDAKAHFQAQIQFLASALHSGDSPFWTPNVFTGSPQIADPQSLIFSPAILLALVAPEPSFVMVDAYVLCLLACGGLAVLMFGFDRRWHPAGALTAAIAFSFGASAAWRIQHVGQIKSYVFFGVTLWLLQRCLQHPRWWTGLLCGLSAAAMVAEPDQVALLACYVLFAFAIHHLAASEAPLAAFRRSWPSLVTAGVACVAVAALPLLLTVLFAEDSNRPTIELTEALQGSLHPASLLTLLVADLFGALNPTVDYWGPASRGWASGEITLAQNMGQLYVGALPVLLLAVVGIGALLDRKARFFAAAVLLLTLYALGRYTAAFEVVFALLPGVEAFRRPADATFLIGALVALMGGHFVHLWLNAPGGLRLRPLVLVGGLTCALALGVSTATAWQHGRLDVAEDAVIAGAAWLAAGLAMLGATRFASLRLGPGMAAQMATACLFGLFMVSDLSANNGPNESTALPPQAYDALNPETRNETITLLKRLLHEPETKDRRPRVELAGLGFQWPNAGMVQGFENIFGYNPLRLGDFNAATGSPDTIATPEQRKFTPVFSSYKCILANLLGVRYIATGVPVELIDRKLRAGDLHLIARTREAYIYENPDALPRVLFADRARVADFDEIVETGNWPIGFDPTREVVLEDEPAGPAPGATTDDHGGYVRLTSYRNTVVSVEVHARRAGYVVLNDAYQPWWRATVDGESVDIQKANVLFRAVPVPAGDHVVRFEFKPIEGSLADVAGLIFAPSGP
jgi:hypothetical protein